MSRFCILTLTGLDLGGAAVSVRARLRFNDSFTSRLASEVEGSDDGLEAH